MSNSLKEKSTSGDLIDFKSDKSELIVGNINTPIPLLSVVIPTYKCPHSLKRTLTSVIKQEQFNDFDIIVVDNESSENKNQSQIVIEEFNNPKIRYYKNRKNIGMTGNHNRCFELAQSEWVFMLHSDDELLPNCLYEINKLIKEYPNIIALFTNRMSSSIKQKESRKKKLYTNIFTIHNIHKVTPLDFLWGCTLCAPTGFLIKREAFMNLGGYKNVPLNSQQVLPPVDDCEFYIRMLYKYPVFQTDSTLVIKHEEETNASHMKNLTIPLIENQYNLFFSLSRKISSSFFTKCIFYYRLYNNQKHFNIDDTDISFKLPTYVKTNFFIYLMRKIRTLYFYMCYLRH